MVSGAGARKCHLPRGRRLLSRHCPQGAQDLAPALAVGRRADAMGSPDAEISGEVPAAAGPAQLP
jgi:hypothetical protein